MSANRLPSPGALVLLHTIDPSWSPFLAEWLAAAGHQVAEDEAAAGHGHDDGRADPAPALLLTGLAFPRRDGGAAIAALRHRWPATPILLLSPTLRSGPAVGGPLAAELGVQAVAPMPITRERFLCVVQRLLDTPCSGP